MSPINFPGVLRQVLHAMAKHHRDMEEIKTEMRTVRADNQEMKQFLLSMGVDYQGVAPRQQLAIFPICTVEELAALNDKISSASCFQELVS